MCKRSLKIKSAYSVLLEHSFIFNGGERERRERRGGDVGVDLI